jgi:hypothetical protein
MRTCVRACACTQARRQAGTQAGRQAGRQAGSGRSVTAHMVVHVVAAHALGCKQLARMHVRHDERAAGCRRQVGDGAVLVVVVLRGRGTAGKHGASDSGVHTRTRTHDSATAACVRPPTRALAQWMPGD